MLPERTKRKYINLLSVIASIISFSLLALYFALFMWDEDLGWIKDKSTMEILSIILCVISLVVSIITTVVSLIHSQKEHRKQRKMVEALLMYNKLTNMGERFYRAELSKLYSQEVLTSQEVEKIQELHTEINEEEFDASAIAIAKEVESLHKILDRIYAEKKDNVG